MIKVSVMYRGSADDKFDVDYYQNSHLPMVKETVGTALKNMELNVGIGDSPFKAIGNLTFESMDVFKSEFLPHMPKFQADVPNYTDIEPVLQISDIRM
ncbi:MAG: EthD family reductase [Salibacteraceae bacterium]